MVIDYKDINEKYNALMDALNLAGIGIDIVNKDHTILYQNKTLKEKFGNCVGNSCYEKYMALNKPCVFCPMKKAIENNTIETLELEGLDNRIYELISVPLTNPDGNINKVAEVVIDITNRKKTEKELKNKDHLINSTSSVITTCDLNGIINFVNPSFLKLWGYENVDEVYGKHFKEFWNVEDQLDEIFGTLMNNNPWFGEIKATKKDGVIFDVQVSANLVLDDDGNPISLMSSSIDITDRKLNEQRLIQSEEKFYKTFHESVVMMCISRIEDRKIVEVNKSFCKTVGYTKEEMMGKTSRELDLLFNYQEREGYLKNITKDNDIELADVKIRKKDGSFIFGLISISQITLQDSPCLLAMVTDITDRKRAEQRIVESEEKYRTLFDSANDAIFIMKDSKFIECNDKTLEIFKIDSRSSILGLYLWDISPQYQPDGQETIKKGKFLIEETLKGIPQRFYWKHEMKDGSLIDAEVSLNRFIIGKGIYVQSIVRDITEIVQAQEKLKESEQKFRTISEESPIGIMIIQDQDIKYVNQKTLDILGYTREEIASWNLKDIEKIIHPDFEQFAEERRKIRSSGDISYAYKSTLKIRRNDGEFRWMEVISKPMIFNGNPARMLITIDINERMEAERKLIESEEKYRNLFEKSPDAIFLVDLNGTIIDCNATTEKIFGYSPKELIGRNYLKLPLYSENSIYETNKRFEKIKNKIEPEEQILEFKRDDGTFGYFKSIISFVKIGNQDFCQAIIQNITKQREAEMLIIEENKKLQELNDMRQNLIDRISHELKTPLTSAYGASQVLKKIYKKEMSDEMLEFVNIMEKGIKRLKKLVENLLNVSKFDAKMQPLHLQKEDIIKIINNSIEEMQHQALLRNITKQLDLPDHFIFSIDKVLFSQVITNIISNAINNTPPGGKIFINFNETSKYVDIIIKDTGIGITKQEMPRLFKKFGKIERFGKGHDVFIEGSGLGLFISKEIIDLHGGQILVDSEGRNKGTSFTIRLFKN